VKTAIVIPARYASSRLPGKPLLRATGKYLIQHVYERACLAGCADMVVVATDDPRIEAAVNSFGGRVMLTRRDHATGTDRVAEVASRLDADVVVNLQGDEPQVDPASLDLLPELLKCHPAADVATLAVPFRSVEEWQKPHCVKVVCDANGRALYFSRSPIPHVRDGQPNLHSAPPCFLLHLGIYAYRRQFLLQLTSTPPTPLEKLEKLEQLRVLSLGKQIHVGLTRYQGIGVDTFEDYQRFVQEHRAAGDRRAA
jgi:3-deoxy-manno-octulosonate cytidylyltransferase (CMP-KDO synthetase)